MRKRWILSLEHPKTLSALLITLLLLAGAMPVLAAYLGPDRTVTETVETCSMVLYECVEHPVGTFKYDPIDSWACASEGKEWLAYPSSGPACGSATLGSLYYAPRYGTTTTTITHPPATISGALSNCSLVNGWCATSAQLSLTASEPLSGYQILLIEGARNGESFACNGATCSVPLLEGGNAFSYWAISSWGDSSELGSLSAQMDTTPPVLLGEASGTPGEAGWYVSPVTFTASASDATSGLASLQVSLNGAAFSAYSGPLVVSDGLYSITFRAQDVAGHVSEASQAVQVDTLPPAVSGQLSGDQANGWYTQQASFSASASDSGSGVSAIEYNLDGSGWVAYSGPIQIGDGQHSIEIRAVDVAGNEAAGSPLAFQVDGSGPEILLTGSWAIGESGSLWVQDGESGLAQVTVEIHDPQERWPAVERVYRPGQQPFSTGISWDRRFSDGTLAPPGSYQVIVTALDAAGNESRRAASIFIYNPGEPTYTPVPTGTATPTNLPGGAASIATATPRPTSTPGVTGFGSLPPILPAAAVPAAGPGEEGVLWGALAAAAVGAATAYALEQQRRRREEEARQAAEATASAAARQAAYDARVAEEQRKRALANQMMEDERRRQQALQAAAVGRSRKVQAKPSVDADPDDPAGDDPEQEEMSFLQKVYNRTLKMANIVLPSTKKIGKQTSSAAYQDHRAGERNAEKIIEQARLNSVSAARWSGIASVADAHEKSGNSSNMFEISYKWVVQNVYGLFGKLNHVNQVQPLQFVERKDGRFSVSINTDMISQKSKEYLTEISRRGFNFSSGGGYHSIGLLQRTTKGLIRSIIPAGADLISPFFFNTIDYTIGDKKSEDDKLQRIVLDSLVDVGGTIVTGLLAAVIVVIITVIILVAAPTVVISVPFLLGSTLLLGTVLDFALELSDWKKPMKDDINNWWDTRVEPVLESAKNQSVTNPLQPPFPDPLPPPASMSTPIPNEITDTHEP